MKRLAALAALALTACSPSDAPTGKAAEAPKAAPAESAKPADDCARVGDLFDLYVSKRDGAGWTEDNALDDLRARGEYSLGYVVDGVYGKGMFSSGKPGGALTRLDVMSACKRIAEGGSLY